MKYTLKTTIGLPREEVIKKLDNPENMKHWQRGLLHYELLSGAPGEEGTKMLLHYKMGKREIKMTETITKNKFPSEFHATYETDGVHNVQRNFFNEMGGDKTEWVSESEFIFKNLMMKIMGFLMPGMFKKESLKYLKDFKRFAEEGVSVSTQK